MIAIRTHGIFICNGLFIILWYRTGRTVCSGVLHLFVNPVRAVREEDSMNKSNFPLPELLQPEFVALVGKVELFLKPIDELSGTIRPRLRLELVSQNGSYFTLKDLTNMCIEPDYIFDLVEVCNNKSDSLRHRYFPGNRGVSLAFKNTRCDLTHDELVRIEFLIE